MKTVFISGPHGSGKSKLINKLIENEILFVIDTYNIDFVNDLPTISQMSIYEKSLLRLYHRFYTAKQANMKCVSSNEDKYMIIDRSIFDSIVYNKVEYLLGNISEKQYSKLNEIEKNALDIINPLTIVVNPDTKTVVDYLEERRSTKARSKRDEICAREDSFEYIDMMNNEYTKFSEKDNVFIINKVNSDTVNEVIEWLKNCY